MSGQFSKEQVDFFARNGYLIVRNLASQATVAKIRAATERDLVGEVQPLEYETEVHYPGAPEDFDAPGGHTVRRLKSVYRRDPSITSWGGHPGIVRRIKQLLDSQEIYLLANHHNSIMTKQPSYSSHTGWHQDVRYWNYDSPEFVNTWLAMGHEEQVNGGMLLIPGSHRMDFSAERYDQKKFLREDLAENRALIDQAVLAELDAGDVLFFHANLFHMAGRNRTAEAKFALVFSYRQASNQPVAGSSSARLADIAV